MRRLSLNRSEPAKKSGQNIPKNRCRTTIPERMGETRAELPFIGDQVVCLSHNQAARSGPRKEARVHLAEALAQQGEYGASLAAAREAIEAQEETGQRVSEAELHRIEGIALFGLDRLEEGQIALQEALRIARRQQA